VETLKIDKHKELAPVKTYIKLQNPSLVAFYDIHAGNEVAYSYTLTTPEPTRAMW